MKRPGNSRWASLDMGLSDYEQKAAFFESSDPLVFQTSMQFIGVAGEIVCNL